MPDKPKRAAKPKAVRPTTDAQLMQAVLDACGCSQRQLAERIGVSFQLVSLIANGDKPLTRRTVGKMVTAGVLGVEYTVAGGKG